jgi:hypothetical protein
MREESKMPLTRMTSRQLDRHPKMALEVAENSTVVITEYGKPSHVLLSYKQYLELTGKGDLVADESG